MKTKTESNLTSPITPTTPNPPVYAAKLLGDLFSYCRKELVTVDEEKAISFIENTDNMEVDSYFNEFSPKYAYALLEKWEDGEVTERKRVKHSSRENRYEFSLALEDGQNNKQK